MQLVEQRQQLERLRVEPLVDAAGALHVAQVGAHDVLDVGVLHLDRDLAAVEQARARAPARARPRRAASRSNSRTRRRAACRARARPPRAPPRRAAAAPRRGAASGVSHERGREHVGARRDAWQILMITPRIAARWRGSRRRRCAWVRRQSRVRRASAGRAARRHHVGQLVERVEARGEARDDRTCGGGASSGTHERRLSARRRRGSGSKPVRSGGVQRDSSASNSSSSAAGSRAVCIASIRLARRSSRCSRGRVAGDPAQDAVQMPSTTSRPGDRACRRRVRSVRARSSESAVRRYSTCGFSSALDVRDHVAAPPRARPRPRGSRAARMPHSKVPSAKISTTSTCAISASMRSSVSSSCGNGRSGARPRPALRPIMRISTSPGIFGFSSARSRAASHICLWPPSSRKPASSRACASKSPSREVRERGAVDRLDHERAEVGHLHVADDRAEALDDRDDRERAHDRVAHAVPGAAAWPARRSGTAAA